MVRLKSSFFSFSFGNLQSWFYIQCMLYVLKNSHKKKHKIKIHNLISTHQVETNMLDHTTPQLDLIFTEASPSVSLRVSKKY